MRHFLILIMAMVIAPIAFAQSSYRIKAGDTLDISVLEDPNLNRTVLVRPDGGISMPIAGNIQAGGNSPQALERVITERLASGFSIKPTVSVALASVAVPTQTVQKVKPTIDVFFIGEVGAAGMQKVNRGSTLLQAIAAAGGPTQFAAESRIQLRRVDRSGHETIYLFDYAAIQRGARITNNLVVLDGDTIVVPERRLFE